MPELIRRFEPFRPLQGLAGSATAAEERMSGLKGHRDVGGIRASIYNAFPAAGCEALAQFMDEFAKTHG